ncbi:peroxiredoxin [Pseudorhodobacter sp.]|uniref:peroxiredoxin n=1 Tax=Pseudorhodobacter sp. TaxID=1934400 RepID=UPI0026478E77|nr:peroxiredoxin [Pseudorhodobacter sp.]MDN5787452.1 peroxiredoxin [Pseudorhodobacter sp.]
MTISVGDKLPEANVVRMGASGPEQVNIAELARGRKVVIFAVPGAFTPTCHSAHVPSFIRTREAFAEKGVEEVICVSVNDPFVMQAWGKATGADEAGITMLADGTAEFAKAMGMTFDAPPVGLMSRSKRYALMAENGVIKVLHQEESPGTCETSGGEALLAAI